MYKIIKVIFFSILLTQTTASFFDEFRGAMSSVENSFGKLLSDVVTDVEVTIGCTILAVKKVLALGGIYHEASDYDERCGGLNNIKPTENYQDSLFSQPTPRSEPERPLSERISDEIEESVSKVHSTMFNLVDDKGAYKNIVRAKANIVSERDRMSEISDLIRRELSRISEEVKSELGKVESNSDHPGTEAIWHDIKALHAVELNHKNTPEAIEIHHILNEIVSLLHGADISNKIPTSNSEDATKTNSNDAFLEIESQFENMDLKHEEERGTFDTNGNSDVIQKPADFSPTLGGEGNKIMDETSRTFRFADGSSQQYENLAPTTTEKPVNTEKNIEYPDESQDYSSFFQLEPKDSPAQKEAVQEAKSLIEKSKENEAILNDYFKKTANIGSSVFDDPDLLEFV